MAERTGKIAQFKGLNDYLIPDSDASTTRSLNAVFTKNGRIIGAPGLKKFDNISTGASSTIIKLLPFYTSNLTPTLYRMRPAAVDQYVPASHSWSDVTGSALTGFAYTLPQWVVHKDTLVFTNEGEDRPRYLTGSGNSADLGGTPPYAKMLWQGWGFMFLGNISDDGSTFFPRQARYSDDFLVNWDLCAGNELNFNETNGELVAAAPVGEVVVVGKSDSVFKLEFIGGVARFSQPKILCSQGILAPASFKVIEDIGVAVMLCNDNRLRFSNGFKVDVVPPSVQKKLDDTMDPENARWAFGEVYPDKDHYSLYYQAVGDAGISNQIVMNFRTGEMNHRTYPHHEFTTAALLRQNNINKFLLASATLVYEESQTFPTDDGSSIDRYYDIDWTDLGLNGEKWLKGIEFSTVAKKGGRVAISVAANQNDTFEFEKFYTLKNIPSSGGFCRVVYRIDPGLRGYTHKVRIRIRHDEVGSPVEITPPLKLAYEPISGDEMPNNNVAESPSTRG